MIRLIHQPQCAGCRSSAAARPSCRQKCDQFRRQYGRRHGQRSQRSRIQNRGHGVLNAIPVDANDERALTLAQFIRGDAQAVDAIAPDWLDRLATVEGAGVKDDEGTGNTFTVSESTKPVSPFRTPSSRRSNAALHARRVRRALQQVLAAPKNPGRETQPSGCQPSG